MESGDGVELLLDVGLERRITGSAQVEIGTSGSRWSRCQVLLLRHSPSPHEIDRALAALRPGFDGLLFVIAHVGRALDRAATRDRRIAYAAVDDGLVWFEGKLHLAAHRPAADPARPGRTSWARLAMLRLFALRPVEPLSQSEIARQLGLSHVAIGKQLPLPPELVERTSAGWQVVDRAGCWDRFMAAYPGPRGLTTYWAATGDLVAQLDRIERVAHERGDPSPAVSGDVAADFYAPWRRPGRVVAYVTNQPPLEEHGFATVRAADATCELHIASDPTVLAMSRDWSSTKDRDARRYADPLITAWDVRRSPGGDVDSAVDHLRARTLRDPLWT